MREVIDQLENADSRFRFDSRINIIYPATVVSRTAYANGLTRTAYIHRDLARDTWHPTTVVHEAMHLRNYDHNSGMSNWFAAILWDLSTHSFQEQPYIAFHEGFATWASLALIEDSWGATYGTSEKPDPLAFWTGYDFSTRTHLDALGLTSPAILERNDFGVAYGLRLLTLPDYYPTKPFSLTAPRCPHEPQLSLWDVFTVFLADAGAGWPTDWQVGTSSFGLLRFYERAEDILDLEPEHMDYVRELIDAGSTATADSFCDIPVVFAVPYKF